MDDEGDPGLDAGGLLELVDGNRQLLLELTTLFKDEAGKLLAALGEAVEQKDPERVEKLAHKLKGSILNFGARHCADTALALEMMGRERQIEGAPPKYKVLVEQINRLNDELAKL
jgi:HPt (histidine-containing phosphotransfer) domain-containing protein